MNKSIFDVVEDIGKRIGESLMRGMEQTMKLPTAAKVATPNPKKTQKCLVPNCTRNVAARKLCGPHYAKAKHFKIDLTQKHIPAKLLKLLAADGRKVDLTLIAGGMPQSKPTQKPKAAKVQKAQKASAKPKTQKQPQPTAQPASATQAKLAEPMF